MMESPVRENQMPGRTQSDWRRKEVLLFKDGTIWNVIQTESNILTLPYFLTGSQSQHVHLQTYTREYMAENDRQFSVIALASEENYATIASPGEYATEVKIYAAASLLTTPVWTYAPFGVNGWHWQCYRPIPGVASLFSPSKKCMFVKYITDHFVPVASMWSLVDHLWTNMRRCINKLCTTWTEESLK